jgi:hypothetical protein
MRLVTYETEGDFRAVNEWWSKDLTVADEPDNNVWVLTGPENDRVWTHAGYRKWVYMGPGLWFDGGTRVLHLRLSRTNHGVPGLPEYTGPVVPSQLDLALSRESTYAIRLENCSDIEFRDLSVRYGGQGTVLIKGSRDVVFDHVRIRAGSRAVWFERGDDVKGVPPPRSDRIRFSHCEIHGGLPPWLFRSDRKDEYRWTSFDLALSTQSVPVDDPPVNGLGRSTTGVLVSAREGWADHVVVDHCEISHGHDVNVFGIRAEYHHNWIHDINDDALNFGGAGAGTEDAWIHHNVMTRCLTAFSFGARSRAGRVRIFRNLVDLREPTASIRPATEGGKALRTGVLVKLNGPGEGPIDVWHNTCVVLDPGAAVGEPDPEDVTAVGFGHLRGLVGDGWITDTRRSYGNVFVAVYSLPNLTKPIAFLPPSGVGHATDGNLYTRVDAGSAVSRYLVAGQGGFADLCAYRAAAPPHEAGGRQLDQPPFRSLSTDDLRPRLCTPRAIAMPADMAEIDSATGGHLGGLLGILFDRARGCYRGVWDRLRVGVDENALFPG